MWVMTSYGVFMPSLRPEKTIPEGDDRVIQIRTRRRSELMWLKALHFKDMEEIIFMPHTDYEFRTYCTRKKWAEVLASMADDIDYTKFKPSTEDYQEHQLHQAYNRIWWVLYDMFSTNRYLDGPRREGRGKKWKRSS